MDFSQPPPDLSAPPPMNPNFSFPQNNVRPHFGAGKPGQPFFKPFNNFVNRGQYGHHNFPMTQDDFDGKRLRKSVMRKTVDYNASICKALQERLYQRDFRDRHSLQPENIYIPDLLPPPSYLDNPTNAVTTRFVKTATNKMRCPIFTLAWTPEGRRLVTGASSGEFTLWNGLTFNFETILQAHDVPVRTMVWSHNDSWMVTGDHSGYVKYWQSNMNQSKQIQAHKEPVRGISFSPSDSKFVSCSDDGTLRVWDFYRCYEERVLRGHGADVKCVHWHPQKSLIVSGSKDNQQPIKLWDPKSGQSLATLHAHKSTVMDLKWNNNGNWLITASRDHLLKLFDLRNLREEVQVFRGHKKEASAVSWHPVHEGLFCSGGSDGSIMFWNVGTDKEIGCIDTAHDSIVWTLAWHPLGHILCSGSNDHTIKFWTRNRPGDLMRDKYNLNTLPASLAMLDECEYDDAAIPGMGPEDKIEFTESLTADKGFIPGLDVDPNSTILSGDSKDSKKVPYSKPIPRNFQAHWNDTGKIEEEEAQQRDVDNRDFSRNPPVDTPIAVPQPPSQPVQTVCGILVYEKFISVVPGSRLAQVVSQGTDSLNKYISSGELEEIKELIPKEESKSPPVKKSRFEPIIDHKAVIIYNDTAESKHYQNIETSPNLANTNIPSLLGLKVSNPENSQIKASSERDWNGGRFNENDRNNSNNNNTNASNARSNGRNSRFSDNNNRSGSAGGGGVGDARRRRRRH
ncbi:WDR33 family protein [Megaselia abdita]